MPSGAVHPNMEGSSCGGAAGLDCSSKEEAIAALPQSTNAILRVLRVSVVNLAFPANHACIRVENAVAFGDARRISMTQVPDGGSASGAVRYRPAPRPAFCASSPPP